MCIYVSSMSFHDLIADFILAIIFHCADAPSIYPFTEGQLVSSKFWQL